MTERPNVVILAVDTLRADHLGCYGYHYDTSPNIDRLATQGILAEKMFCPVIPTLPSFTTLYTGQYPLTHGIVGYGGKAQLAREAPHLVPQFLQAGYTTCAVDNLMRERLWLGRGYEYYIDPGIKRTYSQAVTCEELNARALPWLRQHHEEPFFLFIHYWDPHTPYLPPRRYRNMFYEGGNPTDPDNHALDEFWNQPFGAIARDTWLRSSNGLITDPDYVRALYDREIRHVDDGIGEVLTTLDELGLSDNTLVILMADHGESMTEHGIFFDHFGLYDCTIRVPFVARWPGKLRSGARMPEFLQISDIAPTLIDGAGLTIPKKMDGHSFWPLLTDDSATGGHERVISVEASWQAKWSLRTKEHKFILAREPDLLGNPPRELYDLTVDPGETTNIADDRPELVAELEASLESWIAERLHAVGKDQDPLITEGSTLGKSWQPT